MENREVTWDEFKKAKEQMKTKTGKWKETCDKVEKTGKPVKISNLKTSQVAAASKAAKAQGLDYATSYKDGFIIIAPKTKTTTGAPKTPA